MVMDKEMSEVVISMWKDVGINAKLEQIEYSVYQQKIARRASRGSAGRIHLRYNDPDGMMWRHLAPGGPNAYWFRNARFDELGNAAATVWTRSFGPRRTRRWPGWSWSSCR